jgi:tellurite resistance protein
MRSHPCNSPHAAARIAVLTLFADGHLGRTELDALLREEVAANLGLPAVQLGNLVRDVSEDLLATTPGTWCSGQALDAAIITGSLAEVTDPALRERVLAVCLAVAQADGHVSDGERWLLAEASRRWCLDPGPTLAVDVT